MKRSHIAQAHSTTYHPQTNGLVKRQNRTLVNMLRVYCSRYMTDWDKYLPKVVEASNSTQHSPRQQESPLHDVNGQGESNAPNVLLPRIRRGKDVASSLCEGSGQETTGINELCRRNTAHAQMRQRKKYDEKILQAKPYAVGQ